MKRAGVAALVAAVALLCTGCLSVETTVRVNADGGGTVHQVFMMNREFLQMMKEFGSMGQSSDDEADADDELDLIQEDELRRAAEEMGEGVRFLSAVPLSTDAQQGYEAVYAFENIEELRVNQNPSEKVPGDAPAGPEEAQEFVTFQLQRGNPNVLTVHFPQDETEVDARRDEAPEELDPSMAMMMRDFYENMRISLLLEVNGIIVSTDATYRSQNVITLLDMDFGKIVEDEERFMRLAQSRADTLEELKLLVQDVPGLKLEMQERIVVRYR
jgi:hypothetical protein